MDCPFLIFIALMDHRKRHIHCYHPASPIQIPFQLIDQQRAQMFILTYSSTIVSRWSVNA